MRLPGVVVAFAFLSGSPGVVTPAISDPRIVQPPTQQSQSDRPKSQRTHAHGAQQVYFRNCTEARAAGVAPIYRGQPGYAPHLDRDHDGIACEPYRGRR